jgi:hypothetical protein
MEITDPNLSDEEAPNGALQKQSDLRSRSRTLLQSGLSQDFSVRIRSAVTVLISCSEFSEVMKKPQIGLNCAKMKIITLIY